MRRFSSAAITLTLAFGVSVGPSAALADSGVHVDPGSPAGKQYAIPITSARSETAGGSAPSSATGAAPLFGVGVKSATATAPRTTSQTGGSPHAARRSPATSRRSHPTLEQIVTPSSAATRQSAAITAPGGTGGSSAWVALGAGGILVLVIGGGAGLVLRRRSTV